MVKLAFEAITSSDLSRLEKRDLELIVTSTVGYKGEAIRQCYEHVQTFNLSRSFLKDHALSTLATQLFTLHQIDASASNQDELDLFISQMEKTRNDIQLVGSKPKVASLNPSLPTRFTKMASCFWQPTTKDLSFWIQKALSQNGAEPVFLIPKLLEFPLVHEERVQIIGALTLKHQSVSFINKTVEDIAKSGLSRHRIAELLFTVSNQLPLYHAGIKACFNATELNIPLESDTLGHVYYSIIKQRHDLYLALRDPDAKTSLKLMTQFMVYMLDDAYNLKRDQSLELDISPQSTPGSRAESLISLNVTPLSESKSLK